MGGIPDIRINGQSVEVIEQIGVNGTGIHLIRNNNMFNQNCNW